MATPELPPLPSLPSRSFADHERYIIQLRDVMRARERILCDRIAEVERLWQSAEARYAEADAAAMAHAKRIAELEADAERYRILRAGNPDFPAYAMRFDPDGDAPCSGGALDAAIDAAREAKP